MDTHVTENPHDHIKKPFGCLFVVICFGLVLFSVFFIFARKNQLNTHQIASSPEPSLPAVEIPQDVPILNLAGEDIYPSGVVDEDHAAYVVCGDSVYITVYFDHIHSIKKLWSGSKPLFSVISPFIKSLPATTHSDTWGAILLYESDPFTPELHTTFSVDPQYYHTWIEVSASMDVLYPTESGAFFVNKSEHIVREFRLFVVTLNDIQMQSDHKKWEIAVENDSKRSPLLDHWFWQILLLTFIGLIVSIYISYKLLK